MLVRVINSMTEFKQIIGRGTRVRDDYGKLFFNILDYTGSATRLFADPDFDGEPALVTEEEIDEEGKTDRRRTRSTSPSPKAPEPTRPADGGGLSPTTRPTASARKFYFDGGQVEIAAHLVYELDPDGKQLRVVQFTDYTAEKVRTLFPTAAELREAWADPEKRADDHRAPRRARHRLRRAGRGRRPARRRPVRPALPPRLQRAAADAPRARRAAAQGAQATSSTSYGPEARAILDELLEKYAEHGTAQFVLPDVLEGAADLRPRQRRSRSPSYFGGAEKLREAVHELQTLLYAA